MLFLQHDCCPCNITKACVIRKENYSKSGTFCNACIIASGILCMIKYNDSFFLIFHFFQWYKIGKHALASTIISLIWLEGLTLCGALR